MNNKFFYPLIGLLLAGSVIFWIYMFQDEPAPEAEFITSEEYAEYEGEITLVMYHGEGCTCCERWADYLEENGIKVKDELLDEPHDIKDEYGIPYRLRSCHTAIVDGYVIEGHVPAEDIRRLLAERPDAIGISVPGMPPNAPGMDQPVDREYQVVLFDRENLSVYSVHR